jgi:putative inorganic carbon (hco3(-)) transporter
MESTNRPLEKTTTWKNTGLPLVLVALAVIAALAAASGMRLVAVAVIALSFAATLLVMPDTGTLLAVFVIYTNIAPVMVKFHGFPALVGMIVPALLLLPLFYHLVVRHEKIVLPSNVLWLVLFIVILMISTIFSSDVPTAFEELITYFTEGFLIYFLIVNVVRSSTQLRWIIWVLLAAGVILGGIPLYQQITGTFENNYGGFAQTTDASFRTGQLALQGDVRQLRLAGAVGEMNRFAQVMLMLVPLGLMRFWGERSLLLRGLAVIATAISAIGMALPFSRGAAVAFVMMVILMVFFRVIRPVQLLWFLALAGL